MLFRSLLTDQPGARESELNFTHSIFSLLIPALALAACTGRQVYESAAGWRQIECQKTLDDADRARCMETANQLRAGSKTFR